MKKTRRIAALGLLFTAGMATTVAVQATIAGLLPVGFDGHVQPLFSFGRAVYAIAVLAIGGLATLLYAE